jgi:hypothetical protein
MHLFFAVGSASGKRFALEHILAEGYLYRSRITNLALAGLCISAHLYFLKLWTA